MGPLEVMIIFEYTLTQYIVNSTAAQLLIRRLNRSAKIRREVVVLKPRLIVRESSRKRG